MKNAFLYDLASKILKEHEVNSLYKVTVILPSRRAGLFFKKYLLDQIGKTFLAPNIITINELVEEIAECKTADKTTLLFELYSVYSEIEKENAEPFESFYNWGNLMLTDFNEIDRYLVDAKQLFINLKSIQEIEDWSFNDDELSASQKNFQSFWYKMGDYYEQFHHRCRELKLFTSGMVYKTASVKIKEKVNTFPDTSIYISGFNALSNSEEIIISTLCENKKAVFLVDSDAIYTNNQHHEAGIFSRRLLNKNWAKESVVYDHFQSVSKRVQITGVPGNTLQASVAGQVLSELSEEELNQTVLVLADEQLLLPVIHSLPDNVTSTNITMGYTLKHTSVYTFIAHLFELQRNIRVDKNGVIKFYFHDVVNLLGHPESSDLATTDTAHLIDELRQLGKSYIKSDELLPYLKDDFNILKKLFFYWENPKQDSFEIITELLENLHQKYADKKPLQQEFVFIALNTLHNLRYLLAKYSFVEQLKSIRNFTLQVLKKENVPFFGEPLKGLQILGMLESRALDFKNVIILSTNEGVLPQGNVTHSLIPFDLKQYFKLPTHKESDAVFAHHFYRLLQRAENVTLLYNTMNDGFSTGEKSRFILQLEEEISQTCPNISIEEKYYGFSSDHAQTPTIIPNSDEIVNKVKEILENGVSPTAISSFVNCPLNFYYERIIGIKEDKYDEDVDDAKLGTIIHEVLFELYSPLKNKILIKEDFQPLKKLINPLIEKSFQDVMKFADISTGKNYLSIKVAEEFIKRVIEHDEKLVHSHELIIKDLEVELAQEISLYPFGEEYKIKLKGFADRIDQLDGQIRVIDYKTGKVDAKEVSITDEEKIINQNKALQLLIYAYAYHRVDSSKKMKSMVYSLRNSTEMEVSLKLFKETTITSEHLDLLTGTLTTVLEQLFDDKTVYQHNAKSNYCQYCN